MKPMTPEQQKTLDDINRRFNEAKAAIDRMVGKLTGELFYNEDGPVKSALRDLCNFLTFATRSDFLKGFEELIAKFEELMVARKDKNTRSTVLAGDIVVQVKECARLYKELDAIDRIVGCKSAEDEAAERIAELTAEVKMLRQMFNAECRAHDITKAKLANQSTTSC